MIGIVILNYNNWNDTIKCVNSLFSLTTNQELKLYIIDNCSSVAAPSEFFDIIAEKNVFFTETNENRGYAAGNNVGITQALKNGCDYIMIANNDIIFTENIFDKMISFYDENPKVGIVAPKCLRIDGSIQETNLGCKMTMAGKFKYILRKTPLKFFSGKFVKEFRVSLEDKTEPIKVFSVMGCCLMLSHKCIDMIGLLDENTFLYEEENIYGIKLEKADLEAYVLPNVEVIHKHGQSTKDISTFSYCCFINSEQYYCKEYLHANYLARKLLKLIRILLYLVDWIKYSREYTEIKKFFGLIVG